MSNEKQQELELSAVSPVKARQMAALKAPRLVLIDTVTGEFHEVGPLQAYALRVDQLWVVPNQSWVVRIKNVLSTLNSMLEQHARERNAMLSVVDEVLSEARRADMSDVPQPEPEQPVHDPFGFDFPEDDEVPF